MLGCELRDEVIVDCPAHEHNLSNIGNSDVFIIPTH
jgi:hypothetical protein